MKVLKYIPTVHIHPILLLFLAIALLTGTFVELFIILCIVLIHELGHYIMAISFKWRVRSIMLWIFGGVMETDEHGNRPIREEVYVTIAGPFQHFLIYGIIFLLSITNILPPSILDLAYYYNTVILIFNLLPVWPLDGGKLLFLILSAYFPYRRAYDTVILISLVACVIFLVLQLVVFPFTLSAFLLTLFILKENRLEWNRRFYVFIRFLLKRYQSDAEVKGIYPLIVSHKHSLMDVFTQFRRERKHPIYVVYSENERKLVVEDDCLHEFFHDKQYNKTIGEVARYLY